tara:strand:+ start:434 stop:772 length:339 start_codon:yes stop_codon:yes gene_type:complete
MYTHFLDKNAIKLNEDLIKIFKHYNITDISYGNDCCNSVGIHIDKEHYFQVFMPNSLKDDIEYEHFNTFFIMLVAPDLYIDSLFESQDIEFKTIEDVLGFIFSNKEIEKIIK